MHSPKIALVLLVSLVLAAGSFGSLGAQTNVVVILVDDLGFADLGCQGSRFHLTPRIDELAAQGMRFSHAYAACAVCSPTRAAVLTGRYPARIGVTDWIRSRFQRGGRGTPARSPTIYVGGRNRRLLCPPNPFWMELHELTLAERLKKAGYRTAHVGKWHLGDDAWYPEHQGFDENLGGCDYGQPPSYFDPYVNERLPGGIPTLEPRKKGEYLTDREADEAVRFIERNRDRPFFLHYAPYAVHTPIQAKPELVAGFEKREKTEQKNPAYAAMLQSVDEALGRILDALDEQGLREKTLVIFASDNGGLLGPTSNAPLRSGKGHPHEGGIRVPFLVSLPGVVPAGRVSTSPTSSIDILPTVLELAGVAAAAGEGDEGPEIDGISLAAHLRSGGRTALDREALFWHFPHYRGSIGPYGIVRRGKHKLIKWYEGPSFELYDLVADPGEARDLAAAEPELVADLDRLLSAHLERVGAKLPRTNPDFAGAPEAAAPVKRPARGYEIPVVDIAGETARQIVVDREAGQYLGHPTTVLLEDGRTMICVYPKGHGGGVIVMKRSEDGGLTWSERLPTPKSWATSKEVPTIHRVVDREGKRRLILWSGLHPARRAVSEDDGRTWSELEPAGDWGGIVVMGCLERLANGDHLAMFHDDGRFFTAGGKLRKPPSMRLYQTISTDGGLTWRQPELVLESAPQMLCEPGIVRSPDGGKLAVLLRENSRTRNSFVIFSTDEGKTWSEPRELPAALTGDRHVARYAPDGRLFVTFRDTTHESQTKGDWVGWVGSFEDIERGREGQYRVRIMDNHHAWDCAYPGLELLPDGSFVTTSYGHWTAGEEPYIVSVRFKLAELDARLED